MSQNNQVDNNYMGKSGFVWFVGVVEDRLDPQYLGRVRVRCVGFHTQNKTELPTADLPWSQVILPVTSTGISGLGQSPAFLVEGTWVMGYFRDNDCQESIIMGTLPGYSIEKADTVKGFYDPNGIYPKNTQEVDTNRLAVNLKDDNGNESNPHLSLTLRRLARTIGVATADFDAVTAADSSEIVASDSDTWDQPAIPYASIYPYNHVLETESGHIKEYDDTANAERIHERHKSGTSYEIQADGTKTNLIKNDHFTVVTNNDKVSIGGQSDVSIDGRHKIFINKSGVVNNNYDINVGENANINVMVNKGNINLVTKEGKINLNAGGDYNVKVAGNYTLAVSGNKLETVEGTKTSNTSGAVVHRGKTIDLNP
tara:strand:- start:753 stop:1862 length:1110 start_codon:yes stop_codon:yes gene_type:complete